ncbi:uncharacterized protein LOC115964437 [Quercus lobata]|uniref:uncharacterized protein LOC115964437 n=1 Tax=Quercus lobata TaxID=97700 RepID=UPI0012456E52|nr:uncharacterized protein LOC115964437 [Quercus lobata]
MTGNRRTRLGEIDTKREPIILDLNYGEVVQIPRNLIGTETIRTREGLDEIGTGLPPENWGNAETIHILEKINFSELIQEFGVRFMMCSRVPQPVDMLLSMKMRAKETLCSYASRYWELYNEIGGDNKRVAASTFRIGLPEDSGLRESLTKKPPKGMRQLMRRIEEYKRLEDDQLQSKGKAPMINRPRQIGFPFRPRGGLAIQESAAQMGEVNVTFKELVHRILDRIKHEPYFRWPNKMGADPSRRNQNLYCIYYRDKGHTTEWCRVLKDHLR